MYVESSLQLDMCIVHKLSLGRVVLVLALKVKPLVLALVLRVKPLVLRVKPLRLVPLLTSLTETNRHTDTSATLATTRHIHTLSLFARDAAEKQPSKRSTLSLEFTAN